VSGQLLTEDYYVANKLMKGYIGSANIDTNSRLCMSTAVAAHKRVFGSDTVPACYEDLECADLIVITGSNMAWTHPVIYQRIMAAKAQRPEMKLVVIDPRRTATAESADLHLQIAPGADAYLFDGLLAFLIQAAALDHDFISQHTRDFDAVADSCLARSGSLDTIASHCGVPVTQITTSISGCRHSKNRDRIFTRHQPVRQWCRQSHRHPALPSGDRQNRETRCESVFNHRPTQCHGRA